MNHVRTFFPSQFKIKDIGKIDVVLGVKIERTKNDISVNQSHYIEKILKMFDSCDVLPLSTPSD